MLIRPNLSQSLATMRYWIFYEVDIACRNVTLNATFQKTKNIERNDKWHLGRFSLESSLPLSEVYISVAGVRVL